MKEIIVKTQAEFDALPVKFDEYTSIYIQNDPSHGRIYVNVARGNSSVVACGNSSVVACGNSSVVARGNSSVVARDNSSVVAYDNSSVVAYDNSSVVAYDNSSVVACGNSSVVAYDNSSVVAYDNSSVVAYDNSSVVACGNSSVVARGNSSVEAWGNVGVYLSSAHSSVVLFMFAVCWMIQKGKVEKKSKNATIIEPKSTEGTDSWLEEQGIEADQDIILFKRVSSDLKTQEQTNNETLWEIGKTITHPSWKPDQDECGEGKFHACSRPYFCDEFRQNQGDRYIAIKIRKDDLYVWSKSTPQYPHKIAFREGTVLYECDRMGKNKD